ncbi:MAG: hypothetical protein ACE5JA_10575, partial [bacterium]
GATKAPDLPTEFKMPPVGAWSEYRIINIEGPDTVLIKYSLTGREKYDKADCYWFEYHIARDEEVDIIKMLISGDPKDPDNLKRLIVKRGDDRPIELPVPKRHSAVPESAKTPEPVTLGSETIITPAGKLKCTHLTVKNMKNKIDFWTNEKIPFFGLARSVDGNSVIEIMRYGKTGAKTGITEKPQKMPTPGMPRKGR